MSILLTGGLGYIGSHTAVELLNRNKDIIIVDDLSNSKIEVKDKIKQITNKDFKLIIADLKDFYKTEEIFKTTKLKLLFTLQVIKLLVNLLKNLLSITKTTLCLL